MYRPEADPEVRRTLIGGSDAAAVCGKHPFKTRLELYLFKRGLVGEGPDSEEAEAGREMEPTVLRLYSKGAPDRCVVIGRDHDRTLRVWEKGAVLSTRTTVHREAVAKWGSLLDTVRHPEDDYRACHLDGLLVEVFLGDKAHKPTYRPQALLETKNSALSVLRKWYGPPGTSQVAPWALYQAHHNRDVVTRALSVRTKPVQTREQLRAEMRGGWPMNLPVHVVGLFGGQYLRQWEVGPNPAAEEYIAEQEREFWTMVQEGRPPSAESVEADKRALARLYHADPAAEMVVPASHALHEAALQLARAKKRLAFYGPLKSAAEVTMREMMLDVERAAGFGWKALWTKEGTKEEIDYEAALVEFRNRVALHGDSPVSNATVLAYLADCLDEYMTESSTPRSLRFYPSKEFG